MVKTNTSAPNAWYNVKKIARNSGKTGGKIRNMVG